MKFVLFYHSLVSDWNHGNAHFLRGIATELQQRGHEVAIYEPADAWSVENLVRDHGEKPLREFAKVFPHLQSTRYRLGVIPSAVEGPPARSGGTRPLDFSRDDTLAKALDGADVVIVHEWSDRDLVRRIGKHRAKSRSCRLFFHDTHHRAATQPKEMAAYDLTHYDGVLAYGKVIRDLYLKKGWANAAWTWHEAADTRVFHPRRGKPEGDVVWIGNWGDNERSEELREFLIDPIRKLKLRARVHGVRYPNHAIRALERAGIDYAGWLPNWKAPLVFSKYKLTVHVPRRPYVKKLRGIPTIRPFEALACGIPLISAPWDDAEGLFTPGQDFLVAHDGKEMRKQMRAVLNDAGLANALVENGLTAIHARHTCAHRVNELMAILESLQQPRRSAA